MSELDQTIEELEAEVLAELEAAAHDAPTNGSAGAETIKKVKKVGPPQSDEMQDGGDPVVEPDAADSPTDIAADKAKVVSGDAQQKDEGKPDPMKKIKKVKEDAEKAFKNNKRKPKFKEIKNNEKGVKEVTDDILSTDYGVVEGTGKNKGKYFKLDKNGNITNIEVKLTTAQLLELNEEVNNAMSQHGYVSKDGRTIFLNRDSALKMQVDENGRYVIKGANVAQHEFLHIFLNQYLYFQYILRLLFLQYPH